MPKMEATDCLDLNVRYDVLPLLTILLIRSKPVSPAHVQEKRITQMSK
jgi:hypothetical protein